MWKRKRHKIIIEIVRPFMKFYIKHRYNCSFSDPILIDNGAIVISNHVTSMDQFMIGLLFKNHLYYMASEDVFNHFMLGKIINFLVKPIPKKKSNKSDLGAIKNCINITKEGSSICVFVEGNRTFNGELCYIDDSIAKLVKLLKKPLVICNIEGGYGTDPRWSNKLRKGKMHVSIKKIYEHEEIKDKSIDELFDIIKNGISVNNFNYYNDYKSKKKAEYLERILYVCPSCNKLHTLKSKNNIIKCSSCGEEVKYNNDLTLTSNNKNFSFKYINDWYNYQLDYVRNTSFNDNEVIYEENIKLYLSRKYKSKKKIGIGKIIMYKDKFIFNLKKENIEFKFSDIDAITMLGRKKMAIYYKNEIYQIFNHKKSNFIKYMHMFYKYKNNMEVNGNEYWGI